MEYAEYAKRGSGQCYTHIETCQLICNVNQLTAFSMSATMAWHIILAYY